MIALATPNTLGHWGYLSSSLAFTIFRVGIFMSRSFARKTIGIKILLILSWLVPFVITFGTTALGCYKRYNRFALAYTFDCSNCDNLFLGFSYNTFNSWSGQVIPFVMIVAYALLLIDIHRNYRSLSRVGQLESLSDARL
ncbi:unnamed protein product, partial [Strongylus vulgaris]